MTQAVNLYYHTKTKEGAPMIQAVTLEKIHTQTDASDFTPDQCDDTD